MRFHFPQIAVIADVIPYPVLVKVGMLLLFPTQSFNHVESFKDRAGI
jgi:hypothetical protein